MKKVLLLTCSTGEGHNSAAHAVEHALQQSGISCELADPVSFHSERMQHVVASVYNDTIRKAPGVFGAVYKLGDIYSSTRLPSPVYWANSRYSAVLQAYILENEFDTVICTHLYGMEAMTAIRKNPDFTVPCYGVLTDYVCIPFLEETDLTGYFVPHEDIRQYIIGKGVPEDKIFVSGIPVDQTFGEHPDKMTARQQLEIGEDRKIFLIMTGGVGCENMESLVKKMMQVMTSTDLLIVMTGKNAELKKRLDSQYPGDNRIRTQAFTRQVPLFMSAADVLLTKPGGLSSTEAAVLNIPIVHIHGIPGCETYNAVFFAEHGMAMRAETEEQAVQYARKLADDSQAARTMCAMQRSCINPNAAELIVRKVSAQCCSRNG